MDEYLLWAARGGVGAFLFFIGYYIGKRHGLIWAMEQYGKTIRMYDQYIETLKKNRNDL